MIIAASVILGRFFCGWICPFGLYQDLLTRIRKSARLRHLKFSDKTSAKLGQSRYIIIAVFLILSVIFASYSIFGTQLIPGTIPGGPQGTEAGIVSYINEPFCLVCPMRPLCLIVESGIGAMSYNYISQITYGPFWTLGMYITSINLSIFIAVTILALAYRTVLVQNLPPRRLNSDSLAPSHPSSKLPSQNCRKTSTNAQNAASANEFAQLKQLTCLKRKAETSQNPDACFVLDALKSAPMKAP